LATAGTYCQRKSRDAYAFKEQTVDHFQSLYFPACCWLLAACWQAIKSLFGFLSIRQLGKRRTEKTQYNAFHVKHLKAYRGKGEGAYSD